MISIPGSLPPSTYSNFALEAKRASLSIVVRKEKRSSFPARFIHSILPSLLSRLTDSIHPCLSPSPSAAATNHFLYLIKKSSKFRIWRPWFFFVDLIKGKPESLATSIYYFRREVTEKRRPQMKIRNLNLRRGKKTYPEKPRYPKTEKKFRDLVSEIVQPNVFSLIYINKKWRDNFLFLYSCISFSEILRRRTLISRKRESENMSHVHSIHA